MRLVFNYRSHVMSRNAKSRLLAQPALNRCKAIAPLTPKPKCEPIRWYECYLA